MLIQRTQSLSLEFGLVAFVPVAFRTINDIVCQLSAFSANEVRSAVCVLRTFCMERAHLMQKKDSLRMRDQNNGGRQAGIHV